MSCHAQARPLSRENTQAAFTLIELLIVVSIMALLMGMLMSFMGVAQRQAKQGNTHALLAKVDQGIRLFRNDMGVYPWQTDLSTADTDATKLTNNLGFRLAWLPANATAQQTYLTHFTADLNFIHAKFFYLNGQNIGVGAPNGDGTHAFRTPNIAFPPYTTNILLEPGSLRVATPQQDSFTNSFVQAGTDGYTVPRGQVLSRMASEVTSLRYIAGQLDVTATGDMLLLNAPQGLDPANAADKAAHPEEDARYASWCYLPSWPYVWHTSYTYVPYNRAGSLGDDSRGPVLSGASIPDPVNAPGVKPVQGWRADYLVDAFKVRAVGSQSGNLSPDRNVILDVWGNPLVYVCAVSPGARAYQQAGSNEDSVHGVPDEHRYGMEPKGRTATTLLHSDIRSTAAAGFVLEFELWSCGPDGKFDVMRDASANTDNISALPYNKGLQ